jgi:glucan biosynthesis protein C
MANIRRYDLDWLRVIVFGLLILYHVGMFFVPWGWHIKNNELYDWLRWPMLFVNQWRLPILFVISGMGTAFALSSRSIKEFIKERNARLGIPLLFGILFIVPPQVYIERIVNGQFAGGYLEFWPWHTFDNGVYPEGNFTWHHLWFLPYLLVFSLILSPVFGFLRKRPDAGILTWLRKWLEHNPFNLFILVIPLFLYESLMEPFFEVTHNLVWDWFNFVSSMTLFFYGFVLISIRKTFWDAVVQIRKKTLGLGIAAFCGLLVIWLFFVDSITIHFIEAALKTVNLWAWILTIFGYASIWLNRPSPTLAYANRAVYPFYILHQSITIIIGYWIFDLNWGFWPKALILVIGTFLGSWALYEFVIRRVKWLQPLFGVKAVNTAYKSLAAQQSG